MKTTQKKKEQQQTEKQQLQQSEKHQTKTEPSPRGRKVWKIIAITVIVIFALFVAGGLIRAYHFRSAFVKPTQAQIEYATKIATERLQASGANVSTFETHVGSRMMRLREEGSNRTVIQVSFTNSSTTNIYLIDINTGEVLLHSETDIYVPFGMPLGEHKGRYQENRGEHGYFGYDASKLRIGRAD